MSGTRPTRFALTGGAGYIADRHYKAIRDIGGELVAVLDPAENVGRLDSYGFFNCKYFREPERFDRELFKLADADNGVDVLSICSPNYLHDSHIRSGLNNGAQVLCEKPLVIKPTNLSLLERLEQQRGHRIWTVLQLRCHPAVQSLKEDRPDRRRVVVLNYVTPRGRWYDQVWKTSPEKSGGVITNIGIHFLDMLLWLFGDCREFWIAEKTSRRVKGMLSLEHADVSFLLSTEVSDPKNPVRTRSMTVDGQPFDFTTGFDDLHTEVYRRTLAGNGFGLNDARPSIELAYQIEHS